MDKWERIMFYILFIGYPLGGLAQCATDVRIEKLQSEVKEIRQLLTNPNNKESK